MRNGSTLTSPTPIHHLPVLEGLRHRPWPKPFREYSTIFGFTHKFYSRQFKGTIHASIQNLFRLRRFSYQINVLFLKTTRYLELLYDLSTTVPPREYRFEVRIQFEEGRLILEDFRDSKRIYEKRI